MKIQYQIDENGKGEALYKQLKETALITGDKFFVLEGMLKTAESVLFDLDGCNALASSFEMDKLTDEHSRAQMQADLGLACIMLAMRELANGGALYCACKQAVEVRNTIPVEPFTAQDRRALKVLKRVCQLSSKMFVAITVAGVENAQSQYSFNCSKFTASQDIVRICAFVAGQVANALRDICGQVS
ncbi:MAG: hypothetical protein K2X81_01635, partial [Candidatus Obscuribacterales bacterium]|nr:hypothetical protein [Candidatus Obscuribacterales bacterium]